MYLTLLSKNCPIKPKILILGLIGLFALTCLADVQLALSKDLAQKEQMITDEINAGAKEDRAEKK